MGPVMLIVTLNCYFICFVVLFLFLILVIHLIKIGNQRVEWHDLSEVYMISETTGSRLAQKFGMSGESEFFVTVVCLNVLIQLFAIKK